MFRMQRHDWIGRLVARAGQRRLKPSQRRRRSRRLAAEPLEDRWMLAVFTVSNLDDAGAGSLRQAIFDANGSAGADTVEFQAALAGTIALSTGEMAITEALVIDGPGASEVTVDAQQNSRAFNIDDGGVANDFDVTIAGLTLTGGRTTGVNVSSSDSTYSGGAIRSETTGSLTIDRSTITGNSTEGDEADGGGVFARNKLSIVDSTIEGNSTSGDFAQGGGVYADGTYFGGVFTLINSTVSGNSTAGLSAGGGGVWANNLSSTGSTVSGNSTSGSGAQGGGVYAYQNATLIGSTLSGNSTSGSGAQGGGVYSDSSVTLISSTVSGNSTAGDDAKGGGIFVFFRAIITHSTITNNQANHASAGGGGVWVDDREATITGSIIAGNTTGGGNPESETLSDEGAVLIRGA